MPIKEIACAIEERDIQKLRQLKGIGNRTAQKIIATLEGKMDKYALIRYTPEKHAPTVADVAEQVIDALISQLGYRSTEAKKLVSEALERNRHITTPEELFEEVYQGGKST
jgi:Holliday junction DNA helicase RuvA